MEPSVTAHETPAATDTFVTNNKSIVHNNRLHKGKEVGHFSVRPPIFLVLKDNSWGIFAAKQHLAEGVRRIVGNESSKSKSCFYYY